MEQSKVLECLICAKDYDVSERAPRLFYRCGHSACSACFVSLLKSARNNRIICPFCKTEHPLNARDSNNLSSFPKLYMIIDLLTGTAKPSKVCSLHDEPADFLCLSEDCTDKSAACHQCLLLSHNKCPGNLVIRSADFKNKITFSRTSDKIFKRLSAKLQSIQDLQHDVNSIIDALVEDLTKMISELDQDLTPKSASEFMAVRPWCSMLLKGEAKAIEMHFPQIEHLASLLEANCSRTLNELQRMQSVLLKRLKITAGPSLENFVPICKEIIVDVASKNFIGKSKISENEIFSFLNEDLPKRVTNIASVSAGLAEYLSNPEGQSAYFEIIQRNLLKTIEEKVASKFELNSENKTQPFGSFKNPFSENLQNKKLQEISSSDKKAIAKIDQIFPFLKNCPNSEPDLDKKAEFGNSSVQLFSNNAQPENLNNPSPFRELVTDINQLAFQQNSPSLFSNRDHDNLNNSFGFKNTSSENQKTASLFLRATEKESLQQSQNMSFPNFLINQSNCGHLNAQNEKISFFSHSLNDKSKLFDSQNNFGIEPQSQNLFSSNNFRINLLSKE